MRKNEQCHKLGDILRYYNLSGKVKAVSTSHQKRVFPVEFYVETLSLSAVKVTDDKTKQEMEVQLSAHPRGVLVSFLAEFEPMEEKHLPMKSSRLHPRRCLPERPGWAQSGYVIL